MTYLVRLSNPALNEIADSCGLVVDTLNLPITQKEIEFFAEQVVKECILTVLEQTPEDGSAKVYNDLAKVLAEKFGVSLS